MRFFLALLLLSLTIPLSNAQTPEVTPEQLEILQSLPPEQREAIIEEVLRSRGTTGETT